MKDDAQPLCLPLFGPLRMATRQEVFAVAMAAFASVAKAEDSIAVYPSLSIASEYRFDGVSNSSGKPAAQGTLYVSLPDAFYAYVFATTVDLEGFGDPGTSYEIDAAVGRNWDLGAPFYQADGETIRLTLEVMYSAFPDQAIAGPTYNFLQLTARAVQKLDALKLRAEGAFVPEASFGAGHAAKLELGAQYALADWLELSGEAGYREAEKRPDRAYWDVGVTLTFGRFVLDARYHDTDRGYVDCGFSDNCNAAFVAKVSWNFWGE